MSNKMTNTIDRCNMKYSLLTFYKLIYKGRFYTHSKEETSKQTDISSEGKSISE